MSARTYYNDQKAATPGIVMISFKCTLNGSSSPATTTFVPNITSGISTVTYNTTGTIDFVLSDPFYSVLHAFASIGDTANDGAYATISAISHQGDGAAPTFTVYTRAAGGTKTNYSSRNLHVTLICKNSSVNS